MNLLGTRKRIRKMKDHANVLSKNMRVGGIKMC